MGEKKVTIMLLKVDLQCSKCYKKVKKVFCKFPQIQDQEFDEKTNTVKIKVVCCSPEKIRNKLCSKGEGSIKSIEILEPEKPKPPPEKKPEKPKEPEKKPEKPKEPEKPKQPEKPKEPEKEKPKVTFVEPPKPSPLVAPATEPVLGYPPVPSVGLRCVECYQPGYGHDGYYGRPVYDSWGGGCDNRVYRSRCTDYICEENPTAPCSIM